MSQWLRVTGISAKGNQVTHIIPVDDLREHEQSADCWCNPVLDYERMIAAHNSADGREEFENGTRKPS